MRLLDTSAIEEHREDGRRAARKSFLMQISRLALGLTTTYDRLTTKLHVVLGKGTKAHKDNDITKISIPTAARNSRYPSYLSCRLQSMLKDSAPIDKLKRGGRRMDAVQRDAA